MRKLWLAFLCSSVAACGPGVSASDRDGGPGGADGGSTGEHCTHGTDQPRCDGLTYQTCGSDGFWHNTQQCASPQVCAPSLGCSDCDPAVGLGCDSNRDSVNCDSSGHLGTLAMSCGGMGCVNGECQTGGGCSAAGVTLIYVVDDQNNLYSFDPAKIGSNPFTQVNTLNCSAGVAWPPEQDPNNPNAPADPFSMSVDRSGNAWILYSSGEIFNVSVSTDNAPCTKLNAWNPGASGYQLFGMGFVADSPGAQTEHLFIAGGDASNIESPSSDNIASVDPGSLNITTIGPVPTNSSTEYSPEMSGNGNGDLYAYYPGLMANYVAQIDPTNASVKKMWSLPSLGDPTSQAITAWAFAFWGGKLYIFVTVGDVDFLTGMITNEDSQVYLLDPSTNMSSKPLDNTGKKIVGAGVSTCAPIVVN